MTSAATRTLAPAPARVAPRPRACPTCGGHGELDPFAVFDGSPPFEPCTACLGAGLEDCVDCGGYGAVPVTVPCDDCTPPDAA